MIHSAIAASTMMTATIVIRAGIDHGGDHTSRVTIQTIDTPRMVTTPRATMLRIEEDIVLLVCERSRGSSRLVARPPGCRASIPRVERWHHENVERRRALPARRLRLVALRDQHMVDNMRVLLAETLRCCGRNRMDRHDDRPPAHGINHVPWCIIRLGHT